MIAVDTSALVAILLGEDDAARFTTALEHAPAAVMSAAAYVELGAVMQRRHGPEALRFIDALIEAAGVTIESVTPSQARIARAAYGRFSALNFGDVFSYALAKERDLPLLYKGEDFAQTDLVPALAVQE